MPAEAEIWRPGSVARLAGAPGAVLLVVGESGSGKTRVLEESLVTRQEPYGISELRRSDAVQIHLQRALAEVLSGHLARGADPVELRDRLRDALARLGGRYTQAVVSAITRRLLDVLTRGVAPEVKKAFDDLAEELAAGAPERVLERLQEGADDSPLEQLCELARAVSRIVGDKVNLGLDRGEYLSDFDVDLLLDLAEEPQDVMTVYVAVRTDHQRGEAVLRRLTADAPDTSIVTLEPLDREGLARIAPHIPPGAQMQLLDLSGGNARRVADALHVAPEHWRRTARLALALTQALSAEDRKRAEALSVLPFAPAPVTVKRLLGLDTEQWIALRHRLESAGVIERGRWLHEARRAELIPDELLERAQLAVEALEALIPELETNEDLLGQILELAEMARPRLPASAVAIADAHQETLGVLAAWFELQSTDRERPLLARMVALYAHEQWAARLLDAAGWERVVETGLVSLETNRFGQLLVPRPTTDGLGFVLLRARLLTEMGRVPVPYLAELVLTYGLAEELHGKRHSGPRAGLGAPSDLLGDEATLRTDREDAPTLMVTATFRGVPLGVAVRFDSHDERRGAQHRLLGARRPVFGKALRIEDAVAGPPAAQRSERFVEAAAFANIDLEEIAQRGELAGPALAAARSSALEQLRDQLTRAERLVAALDQPFAIGVAEAAGERLSVELRGARHGVLDISAASDYLLRDPLRALRLVDDLVASYGERVGSSSVLLAARPEHPLPWAVERVSEEMRRANDRLPRVRVDLCDHELPQRLAASFDRIRADARLLHQLAADSHEEALPDGLTVILPATMNSPMWSRGDPSALAICTRESREVSVDVQWRDDVDFYAFGDWEELVAFAGFHEESVVRVSFSRAANLVASLMGYREEDVELHASHR